MLAPVNINVGNRRHLPGHLVFFSRDAALGEDEV